MTERQKYRLYFPAWRAAVKANGWRMESGRLMVDEGRLGVEGRQVLALARQRAAMEHRAPGVDDLRHGCHVLALGRDKSSKVLTNRELDVVVALFRLLADGDDLAARLDWDHPETLEERRVEWVIRHAAPEAYVRAVCADRFGTREWSGLALGAKRQLAMTLVERQRRRKSWRAGE